MLSTDYAKSKNTPNAVIHKALKEMLKVLPELKKDIQPTTYMDSCKRTYNAYELSKNGIKYLEMYKSDKYEFLDFFGLSNFMR